MFRPKDAEWVDVKVQHASNRDLVWVEDYRGIPSKVMDNAYKYKAHRAIQYLKQKGVGACIDYQDPDYENMKRIIKEGDTNRILAVYSTTDDVHYVVRLLCRYARLPMDEIINDVEPALLAEVGGEYNYEPWIQRGLWARKYDQIMIGATKGGHLNVVEDVYPSMMGHVYKWGSRTWTIRKWVLRICTEIACVRGYTDIVKFLIIEKGHYRLKEARAWIKIATTHGHQDLVELFLHYVYDKTTLNKCIKRARKNEYGQLERFLLKRLRSI